MRAETLEERVRHRPGRHYPRGVKRKMSNWRVVTKAIRQTDGYVDPKRPSIRLT
jgi:hypothetical protein